MIISSAATEAFLKRVKGEVRQIMAREMGLQYKRIRFAFGHSTVPLHLVCFEGPQLGYFGHRYYQIGVHKSLMYQAKIQVLHNLLRHELAHLITFLRFGPEVAAHGKEFREVCQHYGWGREVWSSEVELPKANEQYRKEEKVITKVKKLLALAESDNVHEAQMATLKANQLLIHHNLENLNQEAEEEFYVRPILAGKRATSKHHAIADILRCFYVHPVFNYGGGEMSLEVTGTRENVLIADYVAQFLWRELERLYRQSGLKGVSKKASFMRGVSKGYLQKQNGHQKSLQNHQALVAIENQLQRGVQRIYGRLRGHAVMSSTDPTAYQLGKLSGKKLNIHQGVENRSSQIPALLR